MIPRPLRYFATELIEREVLEDDDLDRILGLSVRAQNKKDDQERQKVAAGRSGEED